MHQEFQPSLPLSDLIRCCWYFRRDFGPIQTAFEVQPDGYAEIIFHFGDGCSMLHQGRLIPLPSPFLMGLQHQPVHIYAKGRYEIIGVRCYPWTVYDLLGIAPGGSGLMLRERPVAQLQPVLQELVVEGRAEEAADVLMDYLASVQSRLCIDPVLHRAGTVLLEARGQMSVHEVAEAAHATVRTLERRFRLSAGHTVKNVSGLMRFEQARNQLWLHPGTSIAGLAYDLGYTDQAHLTRDFKRYSGTTPAAFAREQPRGRRL